MRTGNKQEHEYMYNTTSGKEKCYNLGGSKNDKEKLRRINQRACLKEGHFR